jgi:transcriptional regulator with XRE-family HTH domain
LNENLRRALLRARLTDEDVAVRLEVDPKTVRRWLEGRLPYLRHRWALAAMLGLDEADLWPQVRAASTWPSEVRAIYPHHDHVPAEVWRDLFNSAEREIDILTDSGLFLTADTDIPSILAARADAGVRERICLRGSDSPSGQSHAEISCFASLSEKHNIQIRLYRHFMNNAIYRADDELLVSPQVFGIQSGLVPVVHMHRTEDSDLTSAYLESFDRIWAMCSS